MSGRLALRWTPNDMFDATLTYYFQDVEVGGRTINSDRSFNSGKYVAAKRVIEPNDRENRLIALEMTVDLEARVAADGTGDLGVCHPQPDVLALAHEHGALDQGVQRAPVDQVARALRVEPGLLELFKQRFVLPSKQLKHVATDARSIHVGYGACLLADYTPEAATTLRETAFDLEPLARRGLAYERLDQLLMEYLFGLHG